MPPPLKEGLCPSVRPSVRPGNLNWLEGHFVKPNTFRVAPCSIVYKGPFLLF